MNFMNMRMNKNMSISMNKNNMQEFRYVCIFICSVYEYGYERLWMYEFINV